MITGKIAPPTIAMITSDEPILVFSPKPLILSAKIVGNMIDMKKPMPPKATKSSNANTNNTTGRQQHQVLQQQLLPELTMVADPLNSV